MSKRNGGSTTAFSSSRAAFARFPGTRRSEPLCQAQLPDSGPAPADVLIVHRLAVLRVGVRALLAALPRFAVCGETGEAEHARALFIAKRPRAVVVGLSLCGAGDGIVLIRDLLGICGTAAIVVMTQRCDGLSFRRALRAGARAYVAAQDHASELPRALDEALAGRRYASPSCTQHLLQALASTGGGKHSLDPLSDRELQVFRLLGTGVGATRLAHQLHLSVKTVETHCMRIKTKLHIGSGAELKQRASVWLRQQERAEIYPDAI